MLFCFWFARCLFWPFWNCKMHLYLCLADAVFFIDSRSSPFRALSVPPPPISIPPRSFSVSPRDVRATSVPPLYNSPLSPLDILSEYDREPFQRALSPTPIKCGRWAPRSNEVAYDSDGNLLMMIFLLKCTGINLGIISILIFFCSKAYESNCILPKPDSREQEAFTHYYIIIIWFDFIWFIQQL